MDQNFAHYFLTLKNLSYRIWFGRNLYKSHFNWPSYLQTTNIARNYLNILVSYLSGLSIPSLNKQIPVRISELGRPDVLPSAQAGLIWINLDQRYHGSHQCIYSATCQWVPAAFHDSGIWLGDDHAFATSHWSLLYSNCPMELRDRLVQEVAFVERLSSDQSCTDSCEVNTRGLRHELISVN